MKERDYLNNQNILWDGSCSKQGVFIEDADMGGLDKYGCSVLGQA